MVKIIATSDLHGKLPTIGECDLLLIGGDICPEGSPSMQAQWLNGVYRRWLEQVPAKDIVGIAGNHDLIFEFEEANHLISLELDWHYLKDDSIELFGLKIYGTPWQLPFWGAFNLTDDKLEEKYSKIPNDIDILMSHTPPYGVLDEVKHPVTKHVQHTGSVALRKKVFEIKPKLFVCGHIHCSFGMCKIDETNFANVSLLDDEMKVANKPVIFEF